MDEIKRYKGNLSVTDRKEATLDGVGSVLGFDEGYVSLATECGRVAIEGEGLKIESLSKEDGVIRIVGKINSIYYTNEKAAKGIFAKLFK